MKRYLAIWILVMMTILPLTGCYEETPAEQPQEETYSILNPLNGNKLEETHTIENFEFITTYHTGDYILDKWNITDSKTVHMMAEVRNVPEGATVLVEHVHIDMSLKAENEQLDGLMQDSMDDSYHGTSQDGFYISEEYPYQNIFAIEGFSKDIIDGWMFVCGDYGAGSIYQERLTEENLINEGQVYANKMQVVYDILIKYEGENYYHTVSILDEFLIPVMHTPQ